MKLCIKKHNEMNDEDIDKFVDLYNIDDIRDVDNNYKG